MLATAEQKNLEIAGRMTAADRSRQEDGPGGQSGTTKVSSGRSCEDLAVSHRTIYRGGDRSMERDSDSDCSV